MAPHLTRAERDSMFKWRAKGLTPVQIQAKHEAARKKAELESVVSTAARKFLQGRIHRLGVRETLGRKLIYSDIRWILKPAQHDGGLLENKDPLRQFFWQQYSERKNLAARSGDARDTHGPHTRYTRATL